MSDDADRIRQQMQNVRQDMGAGVQDVVQGARQLSDWRYYVRKHPWACVGSAFALGFLATPARRKLLNGNVDIAALVQQLKSGGLSSGTSLPGGFALPGGVTGKILGFVGPILLQNAAALIAQKLNGSAAHSDESSSSDAATPSVELP